MPRNEDLIEPCMSRITPIRSPAITDEDEPVVSVFPEPDTNDSMEPTYRSVRRDYTWWCWDEKPIR